MMEDDYERQGIVSAETIEKLMETPGVTPAMIATLINAKKKD